jgi:hypothetical protein
MVEIGTPPLVCVSRCVCVCVGLDEVGRGAGVLALAYRENTSTDGKN